MAEDRLHLITAIKAGVVPWPEQQVVKYGHLYCVIADAFPVTPGHLLFIPTWRSDSFVSMLFGAAYDWGMRMKEAGECDDFNVGFNSGPAAGQTIAWPHVHLIPRRIGDCADPVGGIRHCVPGQGNYRSAGYQNPCSNQSMQSQTSAIMET
jgi:diadenosine tetraphosphate (Ap4A) HIT family hydrolase